MTEITTLSTDPIGQRLAEKGVTPEAIGALVKEYDAVKDIVPASDDECRRVVSVRDRLASLRITGVRICEAGRKPAIEEQRAWLAAEKEIKGVLVPREERLHANATVWIEREERERIALLKAREKAIEQRKQKLFALGFTFNGDQYAHPLVADYVLEVADVTGDHVNDIEFGQWLSVAEGQIQMKRDEAQEAERKHREAEAEIMRVRQEQEQRERDLKEREEKLLREEQERAQKDAVTGQDDEPPIFDDPMPSSASPAKTHLGDSVYASFDGFRVTLTTENGKDTDPSNIIMLDRLVVAAMLNFLEQAGIR